MNRRSVIARACINEQALARHLTQAVAMLGLASGVALGQIPGSALKTGANAPVNAPSSALTHPGALQPAPAVTTPAAPALQQANLPADLARMNDNAIIIVGGSPMAASVVKQRVLSLDDKAIIIVGGKQVAASTMKQQLGASANATAPAANRVPPPPSNASPPSKPAANLSSVPRLGSDVTNVIAPRRAKLAKDIEQIRQDQDRAFQDALNTLAQNPTIAAGAAAQPTFVASSQQLRTGIAARANAMGDPGIVSLNARISNIRLTPGGKLLISGNALGDDPGSARLIGGALDASPVPLLVAKWRADRIEAAIPGNTRGVPDEAHAVVEVRTRAGQTYRFDGVQFIAAREERQITDPARVGQFWLVDYGQAWPNAYRGANSVSRGISGKDIDCPHVGSDIVRFRNLNGFEVVGLTFAHGRTDSGDRDIAGNPGGRVFFPGYKLGDWVDEAATRADTALGPPIAMKSALRVDWGVFRSHTSPGFSLDPGGLLSYWPMPLPPVQFVVGQFQYGAPVPSYWPPSVHSSDANDMCASDYAITALTVYGPAGIAP